jgi:hypothetical protein
LGGGIMKLKNFQSIIYLVSFFLFTNQAWAADWILYATPNTGNSYYDRSSIEKVNKNIIRVWDKTIFKEDGKTKAFSFLKSINKAPNNPDILEFELTLKEIDCVNKKARISSSSIYNKQGNIVFSLPKNVYDEWQDINPKSVSEILKNKVCSAGNTSKTRKK